MFYNNKINIFVCRYKLKRKKYIKVEKRGCRAGSAAALNIVYLLLFGLQLEIIFGIRDFSVAINFEMKVIAHFVFHAGSRYYRSDNFFAVHNVAFFESVSTSFACLRTI